MKHFEHAAFLVLAATGMATPTLAEVEWHVSVKFIQAMDGSLPTIDQAELETQLAFANRAMVVRGFRFVIDEWQSIGGPSQPTVASWFDSCDQVGLEVQAELNPSLFLFRTDAINVYVNDSVCSFTAICAWPNTGLEVVLYTSGGDNDNLLLHECGHYFGLCHTHGCPCSGCDAGGTGLCNDIPVTDLIADTLPDLPCWDLDQIAQWSFANDYIDITPQERQQVDDVFWNVMSYHNGDTADRLSEDQLDVMTDFSNTVRHPVVVGYEVFVDSTFGGISTGASTSPWHTIQEGWNVTGPQDNLVVRGGEYDELLVLTERRLLIASRGTVVIR